MLDDRSGAPTVAGPREPLCVPQVLGTPTQPRSHVPLLAEDGGRREGGYCCLQPGDRPGGRQAVDVARELEHREAPGNGGCLR